LGYFSSNRPGGKGGDDIYGFRISEKPGLRTLIFKGKVVKTPYDESISGASVIVRDAEGKTLKQVATGLDGGYQVEIPYADVVTLEVTKEAFSTFKETYNPKSLQELEKSSMKIELSSFTDVVEEKEGKMVLDLKDFFFTSGQSNLTPEITTELDKVVKVVSQFPKMQFSIETHTDSRGSRSSNQKVSQQRSDAIKAYLIQNGVNSENITSSKGFGEDKIINDCSDGVYCLDFLHQQNLRTLFVVENFEAISQ
ncbi:MAG TPA: OmpA family protein, partial [Pricia sp.]|nr:OmpA family protein [Pricia sp.]